jgi:phospholipid/cholesterol/gamma-HCH transport system substrate-binding protein
METRANYALVGLFTLAVIAAVFGFIYWFRAAGTGGERAQYRIVFSGSVSGLSRGAPVRFNGLRVGEVLKVELVPEDPSRVAAIVAVDSKVPVRTDTRARLDVQTLTGAASVQLTGNPGNAPPLRTPDGRGAPTIFADRSDFQDLIETAQRMAGKVDAIVSRVDKFLEDNEGPLSNTMRNVEGFSKALNDNSPAISSFLSQLTSTAQRFSSVSERIDALAEGANNVIRALNADRLNQAVASFDTFMKTLSDNKGNIDTLLADAAGLAKTLNAAAPKADAALADLARVLGAIDTQKVSRAVDGIDKVATAIGNRSQSIEQSIASFETFMKALGDNKANIDGLLAEASSLARRLNDTAPKLDSTLADVGSLFRTIDAEKLNRTLDGAEKFASALGANSKSIDQALKDVADITRKVSQSADRLDSVLKGAESLLGSGETSGVITEFAETARSIRKLADNLDKRTADIAGGINRFTGSGMRDLEALTSDARKAVNDIGRAVRSLERNPQQLITGGRSRLPEYSGR